MSSANPRSDEKLVTIGVPIYKRLEYLPSVLKMVAVQDYPHVELIVSDNGENGSKVREMVEAGYSRPYKFRQNASTVDMPLHCNQIIAAASGEYFHLLCDDDEISPNFVSELVRQLELNREATVAYSRVEIIDNEGIVVKRSKDTPARLSGSDFIRATWQRYEFDFENVEGFLTYTKLWKDTGSYPNFARGNHIENAAVIRLCLGHQVVFSSKCSYRNRVHPEGFGVTGSMKDLARSTKEFMQFLDDDRIIRHFAVAHREEWQELRKLLVEMAWGDYFRRWKDTYRYRCSSIQWIKGAFRLPFIPAYYRRVGSVLKAAAKARVKRLFVKQVEDRGGVFGA